MYLFYENRQFWKGKHAFLEFWEISTSTRFVVILKRKLRFSRIRYFRNGYRCIIYYHCCTKYSTVLSKSYSNKASHLQPRPEAKEECSLLGRTAIPFWWRVCEAQCRASQLFRPTLENKTFWNLIFANLKFLFLAQYVEKIFF